MKKAELISWKKRATLGVSVKLRNDYGDYDYLDKLDKNELKWLKAFHREYINADFKHKYKKLHTSKKSKREIYGLNNSRNRDLYNITKWTGDLFACAVVQERTKHINEIWYKW